MRPALICGALLIAAGLYILIKSPGYASDKTLFQVAGVEAKIQQEHEIPSWVGAALLAAGVVMVGLGLRKR
jgi:drug/metabolite transporter (DMT)-like permease